MENNAVELKRKLVGQYFSQHPAEAALVLDTLPSELILEYLENMPAQDALAVFSNLNPDTASDLIRSMEDTLFVKIFSAINTHLGARLLSRLSSNEREKKLTLLPGLISREIKDFLSYQPDTAGFLMDTSVTVFREDNTVEEVVTTLRKIKNRRVTSVYVTNNKDQLVGKIRLHAIAVAQSHDKLQVLADETASVNAIASREEILKVLEKEKVLQIPVTDVNDHLLGVVRNDELINATKEEITEDLQAMFGAGKEERALSKISLAVRKRLPWLQVNLATAFLASFVVGLFEDTIAKITILAVFLPVVAGQSGNTGSQALAVTMRGLALREIRISQWFQVARKEIMVGLINGIAVAFTTGIIVYFWSASLGIAVVIAISMIISMMIAGFSGAGIPMALKAVGQDPATSSSIILTTVTDICGFLSFLGLATALSSILGIT